MSHHHFRHDIHAAGVLARVIRTCLLVTGALVAAVACHSGATASHGSSAPFTRPSDSAHPYVGMWVTADGRIRQELLANGRYDEARGDRQSAYTGRYRVQGDHIAYWDDTGFTADGVFVTADELHHGGMVFHRREQ